MSDTGSNPSQDQQLTGRRLTKEQEYFYEQSYKDPVESVARIEEVAKFLIGATATTSGLFLAAYQLALAQTSAPDSVWILPFIAWAIALAALVAVLFPWPYRVGHNEPASWRSAFARARNVKFSLLCVGAFLFVVGMLLGVTPLRF